MDRKIDDAVGLDCRIGAAILKVKEIADDETGQFVPVGLLFLQGISCILSCCMG